MSLRPCFFCALAALALLPALASQVSPAPTLAQTLRASRWQQRLLLVGAPTAGQADFQRQKALLAAVPTELAERDCRVLTLPYDQLPPADRQYWQQQVGQSLNHFTIVLIGKDGGVKRRSTHPLTPADLFGTIDKMPMRRQEMRRQP